MTILLTSIPLMMSLATSLGWNTPDFAVISLAILDYYLILLVYFIDHVTYPVVVEVCQYQEGKIH